MFFLSSINHILPYSIILVGWFTVSYYYFFSPAQTSGSDMVATVAAPVAANTGISRVENLSYDFSGHHQKQATYSYEIQSGDLKNLHHGIFYTCQCVICFFQLANVGLCSTQDVHLRRGPPFPILLS